MYDELQTKVSVMNVKFTATLDTQTMTPVVSCDKSRDDILSAMQNGDLLRFTLDGSQVGMYENYTTCNYCFDATDGTLFVNILVGNINWAVKMDSAGNMYIQSYVFQV